MAWDSVWENIFASRAWGKYPGEELVRFVARNFYQIPNRSSVRFLELGCGPGANLWFLAREGFSAYGVDGSPSGLRQARERLDGEVPNWHGGLVRGELLHLPFPENFFDAAIDNEAVSCNSLEDSRLIYNEACRVLKPGGKLFVRTFASGCWGDGTGTQAGPDSWLVADGPLANEGLTRFTRKEAIPGLLRGAKILEILKHDVARSSENPAIAEWVIITEKLG